MICKYCRHEFNVDEEALDQTRHCPNCNSSVLVNDKLVVCGCPSCKNRLSVEMWMLGTTVLCPVCKKDIRLSLDAVSSHNLFGKQDWDDKKELPLKRGDNLGKYRIEGLLGVGGMGAVYLATHAYLGTACAIKLLQKNTAIQAEDKERMLREARLASSIHHQNLVAVLDMDIEPNTGMPYIVMEYVEGISIDQVLENGPLPEDRVLQIIREVAAALQAAEVIQLVHRDIKPANIMLTSKGNVKLADLGIAKADTGGEAVTLTMDNAILGTPHYAAPEQLRSSHKVDVRADIYSLGASMYHMLSGKMPFPGDSVFSIMAMVLEKDPQPLQEVGNISSMTAGLVREMMAKDPAQRPANMGELQDRIDRILRAQTTMMQHRDIHLMSSKSAGLSIRNKESQTIEVPNPPSKLQKAPATPTSLKPLTAKSAEISAPAEPPPPPLPRTESLSSRIIFIVNLVLAGIFGMLVLGGMYVWLKSDYTEKSGKKTGITEAAQKKR